MFLFVFGIQDWTFTSGKEHGEFLNLCHPILNLRESLNKVEKKEKYLKGKRRHVYPDN